MENNTSQSIRIPHMYQEGLKRLVCLLESKDVPNHLNLKLQGFSFKAVCCILVLTEVRD